MSKVNRLSEKTAYSFSSWIGIILGSGSPIDRLSENRYFGRFSSHKSFNTNNKFFGFCILGQPAKM